jgi:hypothetical protein
LIVPEKCDAAALRMMAASNNHFLMCRYFMNQPAQRCR